MAAPEADRAAEAARLERQTEARARRAAGIREAARSVYARDGKRGLTIRAVAAEAGYAPGAVYSYYPSKEALIAALAADEVEALAQDLATLDDLAEMMRMAADHLARIIPMLTEARRGDVPAEIERMLTGRVIRCMRLLAGAMGAEGETGTQDTLALWAALVGTGLLTWSGRFDSLQLSPEDALAALARRFGG